MLPIMTGEWPTFLLSFVGNKRIKVIESKADRDSDELARRHLARIVNFDRIDGETVFRPLLSGNAQFNNCGQLFF